MIDDSFKVCVKDGDYTSSLSKSAREERYVQCQKDNKPTATDKAPCHWLKLMNSATDAKEAHTQAVNDLAKAHAD